MIGQRVSTASRDSRIYVSALFSPSDSLPNQFPPALSSRRVTLKNQFQGAWLFENIRLQYTYHFKHNREHVVKYVGRSEPTKHFVCINGEGRGPVEGTLASESFAYGKRAYNSKRRSKDMKQPSRRYEENVDPAGFSREKQRQWDRDKINSYPPKLEIPPPPYRHPALIGLEEDEEEDEYEDEAEIKAEDASPFPDHSLH